MSEEEQERFASVVADCVKTSTELLNVAKEFCIQLQKEKERDVRIISIQYFWGISFYEVKNRDLLAYTRDLLYLMYQMSIGNSIQDDPAIERLVYLRTVLERMRPIEHRMKSHVEKLILLASGATNSGTKTLRPHPERLKVDDESEELESEDGSAEDDSKKTRSKKYVPPKLMAVHYNEDEEEVEERKIERARRRALQSSLIQDLRAQYSEAPEEFQDDSIVRRKKQEDVEKRKRVYIYLLLVYFLMLKYEEDYLIRLQMTKKERHNKKIQNRQNILDELLHFGSYMAVKDTKKGGDSRVGGNIHGKRRKIGKNRKFSKKPRQAGVKGKRVR
uniref:Neuroguidin n=1 Tax=Elaeophora elaphi TaxID=1147741 RepID=A0A0R3RG00_9BILA